MARLLQLSDLHVVAPGALASGVLDTRGMVREAIDGLLARRDAIGPIDAVLVTGDVSDDGSPESYALARQELARLGLPLLAVPGNHDRREAFRAAFADLPQMPESGPIDWMADVGDTRIVGLDSLVEGRGGGRLSGASLDLLSDAMSTAGARTVVVAIHHPPLRTGIRFMDAIALDNAAELSARVASFTRRLWILAGHVHGVYHGRLGSHPVCTTPSLCSAFALDRRDDAPVGFMTRPTGCVVLDTAGDGLWSAIPLDHGDGPFRF